MATVVLKNISKVYDNRVVAVNNISLEVNDKEFVVLVGPSGCGKSTTLRMVAGLEQATQGEIYIGNELVNDLPARNRDIAMVFQNYALYPHMTAYQNLAFGLQLRHYPKKEIERRVQEAAEKFPALRKKYRDLELHFIGHLQTNKVKDAVLLFDVIETVDSRRLAAELKKEMEKQKRDLSCFIQVNTGNESQKGGAAPKELEKLFRFCTEEANLRIEGLMCIPPANEIPDPHFALLQKQAKTLNLHKLSMGMSGDFETAIRFGATHIRVGSALFRD